MPDDRARNRHAADSTEVGFTYELPAERIAQEPAPERDGARLLVVGRAGCALQHRAIRDLPEILGAGDLLVVNRSRVLPARLRARRGSGGGVELLLLNEIGSDSRGIRWRALARPARRLRPGEVLGIVGAIGPVIEVEILGLGGGAVELQFPRDTDVLALATRVGETPLPPYIRRPRGPTEQDRVRYQTIFAREPGSIAAPTAGLHLSERLLAALQARGIRCTEVVLHVGPATFLAGQPGRAALAVEPERYEIPEEARRAIEETRGRGRIVAVGTTTTRALESAARAGWPRGEQTTDLVLTPGARFEVVEALLTNFHLPGTSLLALVCAFAGTKCAREAYDAALSGGYRFYSYGDAMLVL